MKFADYFGRAFSAVTSAQFPWVKMFKESTVAKIADVSFEISMRIMLLFLYSQSSFFVYG
jgi:hypothetical protein